MANSSVRPEDTPPTISEPTPENRRRLSERYRAVRGFSETLCEPLVAEDYVIQSMPDVSPTKWHLAHTSWFFETFVLKPAAPDYRPLHPQYAYLFNSYYVAAGERHCRDKRGLLSRPTVAETYQYRAFVDQQMLALLESAGPEQWSRLDPVVTIGLHHEQQHQELILTDIKHVLASNPLRPVYKELGSVASSATRPLGWATHDEGLQWIGHEGDGFAYDNEAPRHRQWLQPFRLANRLVTNGEYSAFMEDGGYERPELWLSEGWHAVQTHGWQAPGYWEKRDGRWWLMTLSGMRVIHEAEPVCHVSYFEADAYTRWAGARLPTEAEWEVAAEGVAPDGNFVESGIFHPQPLRDGPPDTSLHQMFGDVWQWTRSPYTPYPGFEPAMGALGEYNGKFMCNQFVLRGGSCATSRSHIRRTYRNFFPPEARWQFTGLRLAKDGG
jgi:ergothioneine biosynthesis protein EgtB